ncbi:hypothetical protein HAX54_036038 [Datura stramonium]|uniref:Uncharacterized protein n=1 Tax=Datura stramonium TaxID=4076 RepID=A0ABS8VHG4_DATST|nr:hypothetical protein [Datura stramonium]
MVIAAAQSFIRRVRSHPQLFGHFRQVMSDYSAGKLNVVDVVSELDTLFQSHCDLLTGYRIFLPPQFQAVLPLRKSLKKSVINADVDKLTHCIDFVNKVQKRFAGERGVMFAYLKTIRALRNGKLSSDEAYNTIAKIFGDENQDLVDEFELHMSRNKIKKKKNKEEENNLSASAEEIEIPRQKALADLNLSICMEDEMFELDIHLSHVRTSVQSARALMEILTDSVAQQHEIININKYFSAPSLSCIRKEFKEQGGTIIERLREDPKHVLPQILSHLEPKEEELVDSRKKLHRYWREVHEQRQKNITLNFSRAETGFYDNFFLK